MSSKTSSKETEIFRRVNEEKENTNRKEVNSEGGNKSVYRIKSSLGTLNHRRKTALRTKSSNSILSSRSLLSTARTRPDLFSTYEKASSSETTIKGNYNKVQRVSKSKNTSFEEKENIYVRRLKVVRDSPEMERIIHRNVTQLAEEKGTEQKECDDDDDDDDDDEIEIVPQKPQSNIDENIDGYQEIPEDIMKYVFSHGSGIEKKSLEEFKDPLELDLSNLKEDSNNNDDIGNISELGLEVKLEFPELGEETEEKKLAKIREYYENNREAYKPKRV
ncbi:hypothetical protein FOA43_002874 [Brettanomyces nanus]|uniref:Uncharacterized protein n=1 Tax=Eeniella nana TaxID=13502 RepID=A0A875S724_EENNA|nr:uncharacterized protein FOA43_002874 [Brettanomyces nanus]QPG75519.1 hypothetical protein FOA43_002874 [Brettanomyces nanus]